MSKHSLNKSFKLLKFIQENTDKEHPASQDALRKMLGENSSEVMGDKGTYSRRLKELADAYNTDNEGNVLPRKEWKICYPGYRSENSSRNGKVYYNHPVSEEELAIILRGIRDTHNLSRDQKQSLQDRVGKALGSRFYLEEAEKYEGCVIRDLDDENVDYIETEEKINSLRRYIRARMMADITILESPEENGLGNTAVYQVSPYRIVKKDKRYWLIANWHERPAKTFPLAGANYMRYERKFPWYSDSLTAFRIDLISKISDAYVPDTTMVHWTMNPINLNVCKPQERRNAGNLRRSRLRSGMQDVLKLFDERAAELVFEHCKDI